MLYTHMRERLRIFAFWYISSGTALIISLVYIFRSRIYRNGIAVFKGSWCCIYCKINPQNGYTNLYSISK